MLQPQQPQQQRMHDPVDVAVVFSHGILTPRHFRWQGTTYCVDQVNQRWSGKNGQILLRYVAVSAAGQAFKLAFDSMALSWTLEEWYYAMPVRRPGS